MHGPAFTGVAEHDWRNPGPIVAKAFALNPVGQQMWIPGPVVGNTPALIDFATGKIVNRLPTCAGKFWRT